MTVVKLIPAADTYALRLLVLRPGGTMKDVDYVNDGAAGTIHLGAFDGDRIVSVGSLWNAITACAVWPRIRTSGEWVSGRN